MIVSQSWDLPARKAKAEYRELLHKIEEKDLREWVRSLSVPRNFTAQPQANHATAKWIATQLKSWGYDVTFQGRYYNVVALPPVIGSPLVLTGAHFDSVANTPGADDNASAVAAMLGVAKAFAGQRIADQIGFVSFNCEEDGLLGSTDFVDNVLVRAQISVACAHILEMVGYASSLANSQAVPPGLPIRVRTTGDFLGVLGNRDSEHPLQEILTTARTYLPEFPAIGLRVTLGMEQYFPVLQRSDHAPFWRRRLPAVMWTDTSEFRNNNYHSPNDLPETLDYKFLCNITRLLAVTIARQCDEIRHEKIRRN
ncbi:MAG TPA: M28 family peptidase [Candidatus Sulfotelmatobacter sp.]|nr:M28 family peptidase [Candidatus Sulfotelmatobacter sp.]